VRLPVFGCVLVAALIAAVAILPAAAATPQPSPTAALVVEPGTVRPGQTATVMGSGFPGDADVVSQICGDLGLDGSLDCDLSTSQEVSTTPDGRFQVTLVASIPPKPCPCVVMATSSAFESTPTVGIGIIGAPVAPLHRPQPIGATITVSSARLRGHDSWAQWFGSRPKRTLVLTLQSTVDQAQSGLPLILSIGTPGHADSVEATAPLGALPAHGTTTYNVPVRFGLISIGNGHLRGVVGFAGHEASFTDSVFLFPWGLLVVALVLLQLLLLVLRNRVRRRVTRMDAGAGETGPTPRADEEPPPDLVDPGIPSPVTT
jgi:hypothetical protein